MSKEKKTELEKILEQRGSVHGNHLAGGAYTQGAKELMRDSLNWPVMKNDLKESLDVIQLKIARILNGDPEFEDHWIDIQGYVKIVLDRIRKEKGE